MDKLQVINQNGRLLVDSREVAAMIDMRHADLLEKIDGYIQYLQNGKFRSDDFFIESTYTAGTGKHYKHYLLTRKGCDMVANKLTGEKGVLFTAAYVTKFEEMEEQLQEPKLTQLSELEMIAAIAKHAAEHEKRLSIVESRMEATEKRQEHISEVLSLNPTEWRRKTTELLNKISFSRGGEGAYQAVRNESYEKLEERAKCKLSVRVTNIRKRMALEGLPKSKIDKVSKLDAIAEDARLTEIYLAIVKEMAIQYKVDGAA